jgi:hypothetical protein
VDVEPANRTCSLPESRAGASRWEADSPRTPVLREHDGQAFQPCFASTRSATTICSERLAL